MQESLWDLGWPMDTRLADQALSLIDNKYKYKYKT